MVQASSRFMDYCSVAALRLSKSDSGADRACALQKPSNAPSPMKRVQRCAVRANIIVVLDSRRVESMRNLQHKSRVVRRSDGKGRPAANLSRDGVKIADMRRPCWKPGRDSWARRLVGRSLPHVTGVLPGRGACQLHNRSQSRASRTLRQTLHLTCTRDFLEGAASKMQFR